jgi:hypothetical protein
VETTVASVREMFVAKAFESARCAKWRPTEAQPNPTLRTTATDIGINYSTLHRFIKGHDVWGRHLFAIMRWCGMTVMTAHTAAKISTG